MRDDSRTLNIKLATAYFNPRPYMRDDVQGISKAS